MLAIVVPEVLVRIGEVSLLILFCLAALLIFNIIESSGGDAGAYDESDLP
jgi:hypothetical protein